MLQERWHWSEVVAWRVTTQGATALFFVIAAAVLLWFWWSYRQLGLFLRATANGDRRLTARAGYRPAPMDGER